MFPRVAERDLQSLFRFIESLDLALTAITSGDEIRGRIRQNLSGRSQITFDEDVAFLSELDLNKKNPPENDAKDVFSWLIVQFIPWCAEQRFIDLLDLLFPGYG
ncbi:MAG: hypothetical protein JKX97_07525 [Candidatus Lindowbacteria bacterium]|nr:hypothetical protein [Candidatus Lindowbacteria bacterium]